VIFICKQEKMDKLIDIVLILLLAFNLIATYTLINSIERAIQVEQVINNDSINIINNDKWITSTHR
jgi:hypothetical protein